MSSGTGPSLTRRDVLLGGTVALAWSGGAVAVVLGSSDDDSGESGDDAGSSGSGDDATDSGEFGDEAGTEPASGSSEPAGAESADNRTETPAPAAEHMDAPAGGRN